MTEEQRKFKVLQIKKYEELIDDEDKKATKKALYLGFSAGATILAFGLSLSPNNISPFLNLLELGLGFSNSINSAFCLSELIEVIAKKTTFLSKINDLKDELSISVKESRSMS